MKRSTRLTPIALLILASVPRAEAQPVEEELDSTLSRIISEGQPLVDVRLRYEHADIEGLEESDAFTVRTRLGYRTGSIYDFFGLAEFEDVTSLNGEEHYDAYPGPQGANDKSLIADPETTEINQLYLGYEGDLANAALGRQRIIFDNARFVGNVGWRQNEQTYDALLLGTEPNENLKVTYGYIDRVKRIFGSDAHNESLRYFDSQSHVINAGYRVSPVVALSAYGYFLDFDNAPAASSNTIGLAATGKWDAQEEWSLAYRAELAYQADGGDHPVDYEARYHHLSLSGKRGAFAVGAGWEHLGDDNGVGFSTPLATLHAFNGWADVYLTTPSGGLDDYYVSASGNLPWNIKALAVYHWFDGEQAGMDAGGTEIDAQLSRQFGKYVTALVKAAFYDGDGAYADRTRLWAQVSFSY